MILPLLLSLVIRDLGVTAGELMAADDAWFWLKKCQFLAVILQVSTAKGNLLGGSAPLYSKGFLGQPWRACVQDFFSSRRMQAQTAMSSANMSWTAGHVEFVWIFWINYVWHKKLYKDLREVAIGRSKFTHLLRWTIFWSATPPTSPRAWGRARQAYEKQGNM